MFSFFNNRKLLIATAHGKEEVLAPVMTSLGMQCFVTLDFNSDEFGTFSGEVKRHVDALSAARLKNLAAFERYGIDLVLTSEGSFGPHPDAFFVHADEEILLLKDFKNAIEIKAIQISMETNFKGTYCENINELFEFAKQAKFPSHGLILREQPDSEQLLFKGLRSWDKVLTAFNYLKNKTDKVYVETDMRAMHNPTRMNVIKQAAIKLSEKILSVCPVCQHPGYAITNVIPGLPCGRCGLPTRSPKAFLKQCLHCDFKEELPEKNKTSEDPMFCDFCNP